MKERWNNEKGLAKVMMMPLLVIVECGLRLFKILNICMYVCVCMYASSFRKRELIQREKEKRRCTTIRQVLANGRLLSILAFLM